MLINHGSAPANWRQGGGELVASRHRFGGVWERLRDRQVGEENGTELAASKWTQTATAKDRASDAVYLLRGGPFLGVLSAGGGPEKGSYWSWPQSSKRTARLSRLTSGGSLSMKAA